jgi:RHS repeat-associated protein
VPTYFRYDSGDSFQEAQSGTSNIQVEFVRGSGMGGGIGSILYSDRGATREHFTYNAVGHTVALTLQTGAVSKSDLYEAYGNIVASTGSSSNNRLANTKERSFTLGLDNHGFRYYDPEVGRYISRDPIGYGDGLNVYLYVHNNPINHIDPLGLSDAESQGAQEIFGSILDFGRSVQRFFRKAAGFFQNDDAGRAIADVAKPVIAGTVETSVNVTRTVKGFGTPQGEAGFNALVNQGERFVGDLKKTAVTVAENPESLARVVWNSDESTQYNVVHGFAVALTLAAPSLFGKVDRLDDLGDAAKEGIPNFIYRTGSQTENALTDAAGVSFRDSISSSANRAQVFDPGAKIWAVDTSKLPSGSVMLDGNPAGHVSVFATPSEIRTAIVPQSPANPLGGFGLKLLEDGTSYRIPK